MGLRVTMEQYWIIGFGKVGRRALARLRRKSPDADITIVDPRYTIPPGKSGAEQWQSEDGIDFLLKSHVTDNDGNAPWIVPALPRHLAYEWIAVRLKETGLFKPCAVPGSVITQLPNTVTGSEGQAYISTADFICPENCNEPQKGCPITGKPRLQRLYKYLSHIQTEGYRSLVIRSFQLAPGVGGYRGSQLTAALEEVQAHPGKYLFSTASQCHGVMHAFETKTG